ncbi:alpha-2-macroglobulin family protein [Pseudocnuella soli]|uniref:alpha-2-macroglobulin family protein n=1 Tax=Pseudocnuella soli TaxID=2502779 RepID=UPI00104760DD|nr:carboxypeptidase-like regulatory domain-containing protein [Pseudocnuella soli]
MRICLTFFSLLLALFCHAQQNLSGSKRNSAYTYVYQLTPKEALAIHKKGTASKPAAMLHTLLDSFATGSKMPTLPSGNYLLMHAAENKLVYKLTTVHAVQVKVLNNKNDVAVLVHHNDGQAINNADVLLAGKKLRFDEKTQTYRSNGSRRSGRLEVYYQNTLHCSEIKNTASRNPIWTRALDILRVKSIGNIFKKRQQRYRYYSYFQSRTKWERKIKGYMAFNKPVYKPGDTVHIKAFITTRKGKPLDRELLLRLTDRSFLTDTILTTLKPYRKGGYAGSFVLNERLELELDQALLLTLEEQRSRKYDLSKYDGDLDEDEYAMERKVLLRGNFRYEEYELTNTTFLARADKNEHHRGEEISIFLKATDENGLAVPDGRVTIDVIALDNDQQLHAQKVFLPDTLWRHNQNLEAVGETKITIPDTIFPAASFNYIIAVSFRNSNNELHTQTLRQRYHHRREKITFQLKSDSLHIALKTSGIATQASAELVMLNQSGDTVQVAQVSLPAALKYQPYVHQYSVSTGDLTDSFTVPNADQMVSCPAVRTHDSVWIKVDNQHKLPMWYTLFAGNRPVMRGTSDTLFYIGKTNTAKTCYLSLQFVAGDETFTKEYPIPFQDKLLHLSVEQPNVVYPGQQTEIAIQVKDARGNPVPNVDVTAYAFTHKFQHVQPPHVPYFGRMYGTRSGRNSISLGDGNSPVIQQKLQWEKWSRELALDTIEYYRFLYPDSIYRNHEPAIDSITQIAPFVVQDGALQPIHLLYIDEQPVFFSKAQQLQRYSFAVAPAKHAIRLRTANKIIHVDSIWAEKGMKTFFSINADTANKYVRIVKAPDTLTRHEQDLWTRYMILVENNYGEKPVYVQQGAKTFSLNIGKATNKLGETLQLVGPLLPGDAALVAKNNFRQNFEVEGGFQYRIREGFVRQKWTGNELFSKHLPHYTPPANFSDYVLTEKEIDTLWQQYLDDRSANSNLFYNPRLPKGGNGKLQIAIAPDSTKATLAIKNIILFRNDDPNFIRIYKGAERNLGHLKPGQYRLMLLFRGDAYFIQEHLQVAADGTNFYTIDGLAPKAKDSTSMRIAAIINNRELARIMDAAGDANEIKETFHAVYLDSSLLTQRAEGRVLDGAQKPIVGAIVIIKGSRLGTITDYAGYFSLLVPKNATLVVSAVGYTSAEVNVQADFLELSLLTARQSLAEVVVVGYGIQRKSNVTSSISVTNLGNTLSGKVAGINIRGLASADAASKPLIIVDGRPFSGSLENIDPATIASMSVLKDASATAIYGAAAAAGVLVITTKKQGDQSAATEMVQQYSLRSNFRDYAYWQPRLVTDATGRATFTTTFPDDITSWRGFAIAMDGKKKSGFTESTVKAFKALSGTINLPQFLTWNDSANIIAKTQHYLPDSVQLLRSFSVNDSAATQQRIKLKSAWIDTFAVVTPHRDSMKFKYTIQKEDGYFDGEERTIPLIRPGTLETKGMFAALEGDTAFTLQFPAIDGPVKLFAASSVLPVILDETEQIRRYEYYCNEQLASKLKALLAQKKVAGYLHQTFNRDGEINEIISRLNKGKAANKLWGWWGNSQPEFWISRHALEALLEAEYMGFKINLVKQPLIDHLVLKVATSSGIEKLDGLSILNALHAKIDYGKYLDELQKDSTLDDGYARLRLMEQEQKTGLQLNLDSLLKQKQRTMMGNIYWGDEGYRFFNNSMQHTILVYKMLRQAGGYAKELQQMRNYFLEQRSSGQWRNTYESSLIMETILPDLLRNDSLPRPASLTIMGKDNIQVSTFPFATEINNSDALTIQKTGDLPVYFTAYSQHWNRHPQKVASDFIVTTAFAKDSAAAPTLKAGNPVDLEVTVTVKADADYVMIEVPIPAGCSYRDKPQSWRNNEVHREYFKHKVSIFCTKLTKGTYTFSIPLLPKFTGSYQLNPAKAEMMYFPVFYGREGMKRVSID